jgi:flagellin-like hook-associated protein FlgL
MKLSLQQAMKLKRIKLALEMQNAQLESGKRINTPADVIRWILDNIS